MKRMKTREQIIYEGLNIQAQGNRVAKAIVGDWMTKHKYKDQQEYLVNM